jgi:hypothetical protein
MTERRKLFDDITDCNERIKNLEDQVNDLEERIFEREMGFEDVISRYDIMFKVMMGVLVIAFLFVFFRAILITQALR